MYNTYLLERVGLFQIHDSCKCIDVTKDSKYLLATATTIGVKIFDCQNGDQLAEIHVPGVYACKVELSYSDKFFAVIYIDAARESAMRIYNLKDCLSWGVKEGSPQPVKEIKAPRDHEIKDMKWGALDQ